MMNPVTVEKTHSGISMIPIAAHELEQRIISVTGEINDEAANRFRLEFSYLVRKAKEPVTVIVSSNGGSVVAGMAIYDLIRYAEVPVTTVCYGQCASMGAVIFCAGTKGRRRILKHSKLMIHEPLISSSVGGNTTSLSRIADDLVNTRQMLAEVLAESTGHSVEEMIKEMSYDHFYSATDAVEAGFADTIVNTAA